MTNASPMITATRFEIPSMQKSPGNIRRCTCFVLSSCILFFWLGTAVASAHAYVIATTPGFNENLHSPPEEVDVSFDEPIAVDSNGAVVVRGSNGTTYPCSGGAHIDPDDDTLLVCTLRARLAPGAYSVSWRATSADTHVVHGVFSFGVRTAVHAYTGETASIYDPSGVLAGTVRWLTLAGVAALIGALGFSLLVLNSGQTQPGVDELQRTCRTLCVAGATLALLASLGALDVQSAAATGTDAVRTLPRLAQVFDSIWGRAWLIRVGLLCVLLATTLVRRLNPLSAVAAVGVAATLSASGHANARAFGGNLLPFFADWVHLGAASLWSGGLLVFVFGLRPALAGVEEKGRTEFFRRLIIRFSGVALVAVATILATGTYAALLHIASVALLFGSLYGRIVLAKLLLLIVLLVLGHVHYRQGRGNISRLPFVATVTGEAAIVFAVLALSAVLAGLAPGYNAPL